MSFETRQIIISTLVREECWLQDFKLDGGRFFGINTIELHQSNLILSVVSWFARSKRYKFGVDTSCKDTPLFIGRGPKKKVFLKFNISSLVGAHLASNLTFASLLSSQILSTS